MASLQRNQSRMPPARSSSAQSMASVGGGASGYGKRQAAPELECVPRRAAPRRAAPRIGRATELPAR